MSHAFSRSRALWNRAEASLDSDEVLAQILDCGDLGDWRELFALAAGNVELRRRIARIVRRVSLAYPCFWLAALASLGETTDWAAPLPEDQGV